MIDDLIDMARQKVFDIFDFSNFVTIVQGYVSTFIGYNSIYRQIVQAQISNQVDIKMLCRASF